MEIRKLRSEHLADVVQLQEEIALLKLELKELKSAFTIKVPGGILVWLCIMC